MIILHLITTGSVVGESMGVISDKRIKELEEEMDHIKSTYVELTKYEQLQQKYGIVVEARDTFEVCYIVLSVVSFTKSCRGKICCFDFSLILH